MAKAKKKNMSSKMNQTKKTKTMKKATQVKSTKKTQVKAKSLSKSLSKSLAKTGPKLMKKATVKGASKVAAKPKTKTRTKTGAKPATKTAKKGAARVGVFSQAKSRSEARPKSQSITRSSQEALSAVFMPLDDRIIVEKMAAANRTPGGLYIPDTVANDQRSSQGRVVAVGRGHRDKKGRVRPLDVQLGDTVMFGNGGGSDVRINEQDLLCLREAEIIAIIKP